MRAHRNTSIKNKVTSKSLVSQMALRMKEVLEQLSRETALKLFSLLKQDSLMFLWKEELG